MKEFVRYQDGSCALTEDEEIIWSGDNDEDFLEKFDAIIEPQEIDDVLDYLEDAGYLEDDESIDIVDESDLDTAEESIQ